MYIQLISILFSLIAILTNSMIFNKDKLNSEMKIRKSFILSSSLLLFISITYFGHQINGEFLNLSIINGIVISLGSTKLGAIFAVLTNFITLLVAIELYDEKKTFNSRAAISLIQLTNICLMGCFFSRDLLSFFIFFEISIVPIFFIILIFGGKEKILAARQFFIYTIAGSLLILTAICYLASITGSVNPEDIKASLNFTNTSGGVKLFLCSILVIGFFIKIPTFPFHTWLPLAHVQAPTFGSMMLAGILIKLGGFGIIQFVLPIFQDQIEILRPYFLTIGLISLIYASAICFAQKDIKKLIAYSSIAHMSYVVFGIFSGETYGVNGAVFQMISHGVVSAGLFYMVSIIYKRFHTRDIEAYGRLYEANRDYAKVFLLLSFASCGLPGTIGFIGELLTVISLAKYSFITMTIAASGTLLGAIYMLNLNRKLLFSHPEMNISSFTPLTHSEKANLAILSIVTILFGIFPSLILDLI